MLVQCKPIWSLKSLQKWSCDPICHIRKISSLFGTLGHKQIIITRLRAPVSFIGYFGNFKSKLYFLRWILSKCSALKMLKVVRLAMYLGIFQFYCTIKFENCRIFWSNERFVYKKFWGELPLCDWLKKIHVTSCASDFWSFLILFRNDVWYSAMQYSTQAW